MNINTAVGHAAGLSKEVAPNCQHWQIVVVKCRNNLRSIEEKTNRATSVTILAKEHKCILVPQMCFLKNKKN